MSASIGECTERKKGAGAAPCGAASAPSPRPTEFVDVDKAGLCLTSTYSITVARTATTCKRFF